MDISIQADYNVVCQSRAGGRNGGEFKFCSREPAGGASLKISLYSTHFRLVWIITCATRSRRGHCDLDCGLSYWAAPATEMECGSVAIHFANRGMTTFRLL